MNLRGKVTTRIITIIMLAIIITTLITPTNAGTTTGALSIIQEQGQTITRLNLIGEPTGTITIQLRTTEGLYILPANKIKEGIWEARFPIITAGTATAYDGKEKIATAVIKKTTTETTTQETTKKKTQETIKETPQETKTENKTGTAEETINRTTISNETTNKNINKNNKTRTTIKETIEEIKPITINNKQYYKELLYDARELLEIEEEPNKPLEAAIQIPNEKELIIKPLKKLPIKEIKIKGTNLTRIQNKKLQLKEENITRITTKEGTTEEITQAYAINPEALNFTNATITVTAKGTKLYKCAEWNYNQSRCEGTWEFQKTIIPGQEYNITITPKDPAFGEASKYLQMEWGTIKNLDGNWTTINLAFNYGKPVIIAVPHYEIDGVPSVTRIRNITTNSFEIKIQSAAPSGLTPRNVSYLVIEEGAWQLPDGRRIEAHTYNSQVTDSDASWVGEAQTYAQTYTTPVIIGQVMSTNDQNWSVFWSRGATRTDPPDASNLYTGKHVGQDTNDIRLAETIGYVIIEQGHGTINGIEYDAVLSTDTVRGISNGAPFNINYANNYATAPQIIIPSIAGMDGANGAWAVAYGSTTTTTAGVAVDEYDNGERSHTTEQVMMISFASPGNYTGNTPPTISNETITNATIEVGEQNTLTVNVTDEEGIDAITWVNATIKYPNGTTTNVSLTQQTSGNQTTTPDQETGTKTTTPAPRTIIGETGIITNVSGWTKVDLKHKYQDPIVFVFARKGANLGSTAEQSIAIVRNVQSESFETTVIQPDNTELTGEDIGYLVIERGTWNISGETIQAGTWSYSGTAFTTYNYDQPMNETPAIYIQIQDNPTHWYTGRYEAATLNTTSATIQYEDANDAFGGVATVGYLAIRQGANNSIFEAGREAGISEDAGAGTWRTINFQGTRTQPIFMGIISEAGGDPAKLGINNLGSNNVQVRITEETYSDTEQNHASDDALWIAINNDTLLMNDTATQTIDGETSAEYYYDVDNTSLTYISQLDVTININNYDPAGSITEITAMPELAIELRTNNGWQRIGTIKDTGTKTITTYDQNILSDWAQNTNDRDIRIKGINFDYHNDTTKDSISWDSVTITLHHGTKTSTWKYQFTNLYDLGIYNVTNIYANDGTHTAQKNYTTLYFTVTDLTPPTITSITNATIQTGQPLKLDFKAVDTSGISNWGVNDTNFNINSTGTLTNATTLTEGIYWLNITVNDTYNNTAWETIYINVTATPDTTPPQFTPPLGTINLRYDQALIYDINATDDRGIIGSYGINDTTNFKINPTTGLLENNTLLGIGTYKLNVTVNDTSGNTNASTLTIIVREANISTNKTSYLANEPVGITGEYFTPNSNVEIIIKSLTTGGTAPGYPTTTTTNSTGGFTHNWNTNGYCEGTYEVNATDQTHPTILYDTTQFNISYHDYTSRSCSAVWGFDCGAGPPEAGDNTFDACANGLGNDESVEDITLNATMVTPGERVNVTCTFDPYTSADYLAIWYYNGTGWKQLYNEGPVGSAGFITRSASFVVDDYAGEQWVRCSIVYNTNDTADTCADTGSYYDNDDLNFTVVNAPSTCEEFDVTAPNVTINNPTGQTTRMPENITINATVTDEHNITSVKAEITQPNNNKETITLTDPDKDNNYEGTYNNLTQAGTYTVRIIATDDWNNINDTETSNFTVQRPDLTITNITTTPEQPQEEDNVTINITIKNLGNTWIDGSRLIVTKNRTGTTLYNNTLGNISAGGETNIQTWINISTGQTTITATIDPYNTIKETNETNNNKNTTINISAWQTIYGNATSKIILGGTNNNLYEWNINEQGNIYLTDADATINWTALQAISKKKDNSTASNDFTEIDAALNLTGYSDSVSQRYSTDGSTPKATSNFTIKGRNITGVPIINSTNNSNFITGILWDASTGTEYDGTQNLVFVTKINKDKQGKYGTYDYEITIPSALQTMTGTTKQVYLYSELN